MTSHRLPIKLGVVALGIVSACSLTVPPEDELFGEPPNGGSSGNSTAGSVGNASSGGDPSDSGGGGNSSSGSGGTTGGGGSSSMGGAPGAGGSDAGASQGGAGGEPPEPEPTGEVVNPSFEGSLVGWTIEPKTSAIFIQYSGANVTAVEGNSVLSGWYQKEGQAAYAARVFQIVKGLEDGTYRLSAQMAAKNGMPSAKLYAANCGGTDPEPASSTAEAWHEVAIEEVEVVGGECEIGFDIDSRVLDWINVDVVGFTKVVAK